MPEDGAHRHELVEGVLHVVPRPVPMHQYVIYRLMAQLNDQLPQDLVAVQDVEVVLEHTQLVTVRVPDLVVVPTARLTAPRYQAADVLLAVEVVSPGSGRTDRVAKMFDYADAGIGCYWIVELDPVVLIAHVLVDGDYEIVAKSDPTAPGPIDLLSPVPLRIDPSTLTRR